MRWPKSTLLPSLTVFLELIFEQKSTASWPLFSKLCHWGHTNLVCLSSNLEVLNNLLHNGHSSGFWDFSRQSFWCIECLYFDIKTFPQFWHKTSSNLHFLTCFHIALSVTLDLNGILQVIHFTFVTPPRFCIRMSCEDPKKIVYICKYPP